MLRKDGIKRLKNKYNPYTSEMKKIQNINLIS